MQISGGVVLSGGVNLAPGSGGSSGGGGFQGSNYGYTSGGWFNNVNNIIDKFSFASDGNASDVGDLTASLRRTSGNSSSTDGYVVGGQGSSNIQKFSFSSDGNASNVGTQSFQRYGTAGQSSTTHGYTTGGFNPGALDIIDKFPFASDGTATDVGDLTVSRAYCVGVSSATLGYSCGGNVRPASPNSNNTIDKFPFSSDSNATDVGDLSSNGPQGKSGQNSSTHGFASGGEDDAGTRISAIEQFSFSTDGNATDVGNLSNNVAKGAGTSSTISGYHAGGLLVGRVSAIEKFSFSDASTTTNVGSLTLARSSTSSQQY